jgi:DnaJ-class molecular chaperone
MKDEILSKIRSVCPKCLGKTYYVAANGNLNICDECGGKGYQTLKELEDADKELGETPGQKKKEK